MPSKSAKQHNFMAAIANNPAFAKKVGVPQSVGKDYAAADKGKKFVAGGINKQNTRHGKLDMPFNKLNRFAGMKAGGMMKKGRRFNGEEGSDVTEKEEKPDLDRRGEVGEAPKKSFADSFASARRSGDKTFMWRGKEYTTEMAKPKVEKAKPSMRFPSAGAMADKISGRDKMPFAKGGMAKGVEKQLPTSKQMGNLNMKSGGMKESKAMVGKEVAFMKKKGAPASMIKHEAAEMGAMKKGGMAKYAKGGGIESRGKTKGTVIKMATGGVVRFAKGGGIESKGKTKGTMIKMKGC